MPQIESFDGISIHYQVRGTGAPALIFVHGWSCNLSFWDAQVEYFKKSHLVAALDLPGHGKSGTGDRKWDIETFGRDVAAVQEALEVESTILVGHSSGAMVIVEAEAWLQNRAIHLVGVDAMYYPIYSATAQDQIDEFLRPYEEDFSDSVDRSVARMLPEGVDQGLMKRIASGMSATDPDVALPSFRSIYAWDFRQALKKIQTPLTCICSEDRLSTYDRRQFEDFFDIRTIAGVGHFVMMEKPAEFNTVLEDVIRGVSAQEGGA